MSDGDDLQDKDLARAYREASEEQPSVGMDARILAAARAAARPRAARMATSWVSSWRIPIALAATVLLSFTLTLMVREGEEGRLAAPDESTGSARPAARSAEAESKAAPKAVPEPTLKTTPKPAPKVTTTPEPDAKRKSEAFVADPAAGAAGNLSREPQTMRSVPEAPARDDVRSAIMKEQAAREKARPEAGSAQPALAAPAAKRADMAERNLRSPEQWLADIRKLKQDGKLAEAEASLAEFKKSYPQFPLPEDLK